MSASSLDPYPLIDDLAPPRQFPAPVRSRVFPHSTLPTKSARLHWTARIVTWVVVASFLIFGGLWAWKVGLHLRDDLWENTRTIRFEGDIAAAFRYGNQVLRHAEAQNNLANMADAKAGVQDKPADADPNAGWRRLTWHEVLAGIVDFYDYKIHSYEGLHGVEGPAAPGEPEFSSDLGLDYPPVRLSIMTLWVRHVERQHPDIDYWPGRDTPAATDVHREDIARPLLMLNTCCEAAAALAAFFLAWFWMSRQARPAAKSPGPAADYRWEIPHGLAAFFVAALVFWYSLSVFERPPMPPTPRICVNKPAIGPSAARLIGVIDSEEVPTTAYFQWGTTIFYDHSAPAALAAMNFDNGRAPVTVTAITSAYPAGQVIHYRLVATNANGKTCTDDETYVSGDVATPVVRKPNDPTWDYTRPSLVNKTYGGAAYPDTTPLADWYVWLGLFILLGVLVWTARRLPWQHRGWACGSVAAGLIWFNPMVLVNSHVWPQWDVWVLPFFLWAALAASLDWWIVAGALLGVGCMFKGQLLLVAPIFVLWPLLGGRLWPVIRLVAGFGFGAAFILCPWLVTRPILWQWILRLVIAGLLATVFMAWPRFKWWLLLPVGLLVTLLAIPPESGTWFSTLRAAVRGIFHASTLSVPRLPLYIMLAVMALLALWKVFDLYWVHSQPRKPVYLRWLHPLNNAAFLLVAAFALGVILSGKYFDGNTSWYRVGFKYGTEKHPEMAMGAKSFTNLPELMESKYDWEGLRTVAAHLHLNLGVMSKWFGLDSSDKDIPIKSALVILYAIMTIACGIAAALHAKRKDPRLLAVLCAPWALFPILLCQMSERYLLWASAISALMVCCSVGWTWLGVIFSVVAAAMTAHQCMATDPSRWWNFHVWASNLYFDGAWLMILLALLFFVAALIPSRRIQEPQLATG